ncbi:MAG: hypothetical protein N4A74_19850 [Carboxylicivirga sp.]|jgi:hypothetical protein|nr:hypothetical protein [Carboxylicivirga sp.]
MKQLLKSKLIIVVGVNIVAFGLLYSYKNYSYRKYCVNEQEIQDLNDSGALMHLDLVSLNLGSHNLFDELNKTQEKYTLVFRVPRFSCGSCVNREIITIDKHMPEHLADSIIAIVDFDQHRLFSAYSKSFSTRRFKIFNYNKVLTKFDKNKKPYLILVNNNLKILDVFIVDKQDANATKLFMKNIEGPR